MIWNAYAGTWESGAHQLPRPRPVHTLSPLTNRGTWLQQVVQLQVLQLLVLFFLLSRFSLFRSLLFCLMIQVMPQICAIRSV